MDSKETGPFICPIHKKEMPEQPKFPGIFDCREPGCDQMVITGTGERNFHESLCRVAGMTSDEIIATWNRDNPKDPW